MATRKKGAAGFAPAAAPKGEAAAAPATVGEGPQVAAALGDGAIEGVAENAQTALNPPATTGAIVLPEGGATGEGDAVIAAAVVFAQQPGQIASVLEAPVLATDTPEGGVVSKAAQAPARVIKVQSVSAQGRWRIGRRFTREVTKIDADALSDDEFDRLLADPQLVVDLSGAAEAFPADDD